MFSILGYSHFYYFMHSSWLNVLTQIGILFLSFLSFFFSNKLINFLSTIFSFSKFAHIIKKNLLVRKWLFITHSYGCIIHAVLRFCMFQKKSKSWPLYLNIPDPYPSNTASPKNPFRNQIKIFLKSTIYAVADYILQIRWMKG